MGKTIIPGAVIERGKILSVTANGYTIASFDRNGIETPPIKAVGDTTYTVGAMVYFFMFPDGTGKILCGL